jgi:hypothetical protein
MGMCPVACCCIQELTPALLLLILQFMGAENYMIEVLVESTAAWVVTVICWFTPLAPIHHCQ